MSKHRYLAAQFVAILTDDLWRENATNANDMAQRLAAGLRELGVQITQPVEVNAVFALLPDSQALRDRFHFYVWNADEVRLMCSWDTTAGDVDEFLAAVGEHRGG